MGMKERSTIARSENWLLGALCISNDFDVWFLHEYVLDTTVSDFASEGKCVVSFWGEQVCLFHKQNVCLNDCVLTAGVFV